MQDNFFSITNHNKNCFGVTAVSQQYDQPQQLIPAVNIGNNSKDDIHDNSIKMGITKAESSECC
jgi:hypothetical protein